MESQFIKKQVEAKNIISFFFVKPKAFVFEPGDFTELAFDYPNDDGGKRWFTISSAPEETDVRITTKLRPKLSEFKAQLTKLKEGDKVYLSPALGKFNLPRDETQKLLFVAGGVGITPFRSMLAHTTKTKEQRDIDLVYIASNNEYIFKDLLEKSCAKIRYEPSTFDVDSLNTDDRLIYLSGPEPMIKKYCEKLLASGVHKTQIKFDYFPGYTTF